MDVWEPLVTILGHLGDSYYSECLALRWRQWERMNSFYMNSKEPDPSFWWLGSDVDPGHIKNRPKFPHRAGRSCVPIVFFFWSCLLNLLGGLHCLSTYRHTTVPTSLQTLQGLKSSSNTSLALDHMTDLTQESMLTKLTFLQTTKYVETLHLFKVHFQISVGTTLRFEAQ